MLSSRLWWNRWKRHVINNIIYYYYYYYVVRWIWYRRRRCPLLPRCLPLACASLFVGDAGHWANRGGLNQCWIPVIVGGGTRSSRISPLLRLVARCLRIWVRRDRRFLDVLVGRPCWRELQLRLLRHFFRGCRPSYYIFFYRHGRRVAAAAAVDIVVVAAIIVGPRLVVEKID